VNKTNFAMLLGGIGIGAALAVLFAPKSGEDTRAQIRTTLANGKQKVVDQGNQVKETVLGEVNRLGSAIDAGRDAYRGHINGAADKTGLRVHTS
jgi:gas vesicle protein